MNETKTCFNCEHSYGTRSVSRCGRVGDYCDHEMKFGGRCAGPRDGAPEMNLWERKKSRWYRIKRWLYAWIDNPDRPR